MIESFPASRKKILEITRIWKIGIKEIMKIMVFLGNLWESHSAFYKNTSFSGNLAVICVLTGFSGFIKDLRFLHCFVRPFNALCDVRGLFSISIQWILFSGLLDIWMWWSRLPEYIMWLLWENIWKTNTNENENITESLFNNYWLKNA